MFLYVKSSDEDLIFLRQLSMGRKTIAKEKEY